MYLLYTSSDAASFQFNTRSCQSSLLTSVLLTRIILVAAKMMVRSPTWVWDSYLSLGSLSLPLPSAPASTKAYDTPNIGKCKLKESVGACSLGPIEGQNRSEKARDLREAINGFPICCRLRRFFDMILCSPPGARVRQVFGFRREPSLSFSFTPKPLSLRGGVSDRRTHLRLGRFGRVVFEHQPARVRVLGQGPPRPEVLLALGGDAGRVGDTLCRAEGTNVEGVRWVAEKKMGGGGGGEWTCCGDGVYASRRERLGRRSENNIM